MAWNQWFRIRSETVFNQKSPVVISRSADQFDLFKIGADGAVWTTFWNTENGWSAWFQIHPETVFDSENAHITAISRKSNQIDLFTTGLDGAVWSTFWTQEQGWNTWFQIHPQTGFSQHTPVTVISREPEQLDIFKIGFDGVLWSNFWNQANGWHDWFQIHPEILHDINASVCALARKAGQLDLFVPLLYGSVWTTFWNDASGWNDWFEIHSETAFNHPSISAVSRNPDQIDLFKIDNNGVVLSTFWNPDNGWNAWFPIHAETVFNPEGIVTAISRNPDQIDLFTTGLDGAVWSSFWNFAKGWSSWFQIHPKTVFNQLSEVACIARTPNNIDLFRIGFDGVLWTTFWQLESVTLHQDIITSGIDAFGGWVEVTIYEDGNVRFKGHVHDSGAEGYDFTIRTIIHGDSPVVLVKENSGHVEGTVHGDIFDAPQRNFDWDETTYNPHVAASYYDIIRNIKMEVYSSNTGDLSGILEDIADFAIRFIGGALLINPFTGLIIFVGVEIVSLATGAGFVGGARIIGGVLWMAGPYGTLYAIIAEGIATLGEHEREPWDLEYDFANNNVFKGKLPPKSDIVITDTIGGGNRPFTMPRYDGKITLNMGTAGYNDPLNYNVGVGSNQVKGQTFIHELTHAWQIKYCNLEIGLLASALASKVCEITDGQNAVYDPGADATKPFGEFNLEQQATIVDRWFRDCLKDDHGNITTDDIASPWYHYIEGNIRVGQT